MNFSELAREKSIDLRGKNLRDEDLDVVNEVLRKSEVIEWLDLGINQLTLADGKFTDALAHNNTLNELCLNVNKIGVEGAKRLADALKVNKTLQDLILGYNEIGDEGVKHIADALMENETIEEITFYHNNIGDDGAKSLANCFMINESVRVVSLHSNNITDDGAKKLIEALKRNHSIRQLRMCCNPMNKHVEAEIKVSLLEDSKRKVPNALTKNLRSTILSRDKEIATLKTELATKERRIEIMTTAIRSPLEQVRSIGEQLRNIIDPVDLTGDEQGPSNKRARTDGSTVRSNLAFLHQQNQEHTHTLVQVKQEKNAAEANLKSVQDQKESLVTDLKEAKEDAEDANETVQQQLLATDIWQRRFDELAALVAGQADGADIAEIRNRPLANGN